MNRVRRRARTAPSRARAARFGDSSRARRIKPIAAKSHYASFDYAYPGKGPQASVATSDWPRQFAVERPRAADWASARTCRWQPPHADHPIAIGYAARRCERPDRAPAGFREAAGVGSRRRMRKNVTCCWPRHGPPSTWAPFAERGGGEEGTGDLRQSAARRELLAAATVLSPDAADRRFRIEEQFRMPAVSLASRADARRISATAIALLRHPTRSRR